jgi:hypothetical protein
MTSRHSLSLSFQLSAAGRAYFSSFIDLFSVAKIQIIFAFQSFCFFFLNCDSFSMRDYESLPKI